MLWLLFNLNQRRFWTVAPRKGYLGGFSGIESILTTPCGQGGSKRGSTCYKSFKKMFWKKAEGGVVAYLSSDGAAVV